MAMPYWDFTKDAHTASAAVASSNGAVSKDAAWRESELFTDGLFGTCGKEGGGGLPTANHGRPCCHGP